MMDEKTRSAIIREDIEALILKIEQSVGLKCYTCGSEMKHAAGDSTGTYHSCAGEGAKFLKHPWNSEKYKKALQHARDSRRRITREAQSTAKHII